MLHAGRALFALALLCAAAARANPLADPSPLGLRTQGTLRELFLDLTLADARPLARPRLELRYALANDWGLPTTYQRGDTFVDQQLDEQADSLTALVTVPWRSLFGPGPALPSGRPLFQRLSTALEARATLHWGGFSDGPIEAWHDLTGAFNFERGLRARDQIDLSLSQAGGPTAFDIHSSRLAFGDLVARTQLVLFEGGYSSGPLPSDGELPPARALSARFDLKLPTGALSRLGGSGGLDAGLGLAGTAELFTWLTGHALATVSAFSNWSSAIDLRPKPWHASAEFSLVAILGGFSFLLEDRVVSPLLMPGWQRQEFLGNDGYLSSTLAGAFRTHNQVSWGLRYAGLSLWLSEDFTPGSNPRSKVKWLYESNHPDVVIGLAYSRNL